MKWEIRDDVLYIDGRKNLIEETRLYRDHIIMLIIPYRFFRPNIDQFRGILLYVMQLEKDSYKIDLFSFLFSSSRNLLTEVAIVRADKLFYGEECKNLIESYIVLNKLME